MIPDSFKQQLLNRVDIVDVVSRYVQIKKAGANFQGLCPFHNEKTPSFSVSPAKQFYHCFGCGAHGNAIGFLMAYASMGYIDAMKELASSVGMQLPDMQPRSPAEAARREREPDLLGVTEAAMQFYRAQLKRSPQAVEYLKRRGLTGEIAARFRVGYAPDGWQALKEAFPNYDDKALVESGLVIEADGKRYDRFRDRVMFPIFNTRGAVIGFGGRVIGGGEPKYLNSPETPLFEKGREVYGLAQAREAIRAAGRVLVVEGYMDVVALAQFDVGYAVATLGTATTPTHVTKLLRLADELVFCFDGDAAGRKAAWRALEVCLPLVTDAKPIKFLFLPEEHDPDTYIREHGKEGFEAQVRSAETLSQFFLARLRAESDLASPEGGAKLMSTAKPYLQKVTAPALRLLLANALGELARVPDSSIADLLELPRPQFQRRAPARPNYSPPDYPEWHLLVSVLTDLALAEQVDAGLLRPELPESAALLAIRDACRESEDPPSLGQLMDKFEKNPWVASVLRAHRFSEEIEFTAEQAATQCVHALTKLDLWRREKELTAMRTKGAMSKEDLIAFRDKNLAYKRLQGALPSP
ncbi:MAG: DNA primase [Betaproteobacteria bacterium]